MTIWQFFFLWEDLLFFFYAPLPSPDRLFKKKKKKKKKKKSITSTPLSSVIEMDARIVVDRVNWSALWNDPNTANIRLLCTIAGKETVYYLHSFVISTIPYFEALLEAASTDALVASSEPTTTISSSSSSSSSSSASTGGTHSNGVKKRSRGVKSTSVTSTPTMTLPTTSTTSATRHGRKKKKKTIHEMENASLILTASSVTSSSSSSSQTTPPIVSAPSTQAVTTYRRVLCVDDPYTTHSTIIILRSLYTGSLDLPTSLPGWIELFRQGMRLQIRTRTLEAWLEYIADLLMETHVMTTTTTKPVTGNVISTLDEEEKKEEKIEVGEEAKKEKGMDHANKSTVCDKMDTVWVQILDFISSFYSLFRQETAMKRIVCVLLWSWTMEDDTPRYLKPHHLSTLFRTYIDTKNTNCWITLNSINLPKLMKYCQDTGVDLKLLGEFFRTLLPYISRDDLVVLITNGTLSRMDISDRECMDVLALCCNSRIVYIPRSRPEVYPALFSDDLSSITTTTTTTTTNTPWDRRSARLLFDSHVCSTYSSTRVGEAAEPDSPRYVAWTHTKLAVGKELHVAFECMDYTFIEGRQSHMRLGLQPLFMDSESCMLYVSFGAGEDKSAIHTHTAGITKGDVWEFKAKRDSMESDVHITYRGPTLSSPWRHAISKVPFSTPLHVMAEVIEYGATYTLDLAVRYPLM